MIEMNGITFFIVSLVIWLFGFITGGASFLAWRISKKMDKINKSLQNIKIDVK